MRYAWLLLLVSCITAPTTRPRTTIDLATLQLHKDDLGSIVAAELAAHHELRAFHALEVAKTRPFAAMQLDYGSRSMTDLRPVFAQLFAAPAGEQSRGLKLVTGTAVTGQHTADD